jgi:hypothetical protein
MKIEIPLPGYWQKVKHGKESRIPKLIEPYDDDLSVTISEKIESVFDAQASFKEQILTDKRVNLVVPQRLTNPDPLIERARTKLEEESKSEWRKEGLVSSSYQNLDIKVGRNSIARACRIFDTLIKALKARGHTLHINHNTTSISIFGGQLEIALREKTNQREITEPYRTTDYVANGILAIQVGPRWHLKEFKDGTTKLENQILNILAWIEWKGDQERSSRIESEKREAIRKEQERIEKELYERKKHELERFKNLIKDAKRYEEVKILRAYIDELYRRATNAPNGKLRDYIEWAKAKTDWYDPDVSSHDELLNDVNKDNLTLRERNFW